MLIHPLIKKTPLNASHTHFTDIPHTNIDATIIVKLPIEYKRPPRDFSLHISLHINSAICSQPFPTHSSPENALNTPLHPNFLLHSRRHFPQSSHHIPCHNKSSHKAQILRFILQIHIFTLLHLYRTQPKETPKPPRDNLIKTKHLSNNLKQQISVKSSYEFDCLDLTIRLAYRAVEQKVIFYKTETIKALYN